MVENIFAAYLQLNRVIVSQAVQRICSVQVCRYTGHRSQVTCTGQCSTDVMAKFLR